ncbi:MAG: 23S rRNA (pseudouridine(1915)-N(3))-methyltransferase RlmH [Kofleriaceae bacterium]
MKVSVIAVGRLKERYWIDAEAEYVKRLRPYCTLRVVEVKDEAGLLAAVPAGATLIALDERGPSVSSLEFAQGVLAAGELHGGGAPLALAIGGADGHSDAVRARADRLLSFGRLTIAHRLVRLLVLEQLYRGFRIVRGEPYHRE